MSTPEQSPQWLDWALQLQAIAQNGLTYIRDPFDAERYRAIQRIAAEMLAAGSATPLEPILDLFAGEVGYATPKVDVRGVVFRADKLLLVQELFDDRRWSLPGGWVDINDSPSTAVQREIFEETGFETRAVKLLAVFDRARHPHPPRPYSLYKLFIRCELTGGEPRTSIETGQAAFFAEDELPELSVGRVTPGQIARMFAHYRHPEWPTDFD